MTALGHATCHHHPLAMSTRAIRYRSDFRLLLTFRVFGIDPMANYAFCGEDLHHTPRFKVVNSHSILRIFHPSYSSLVQCHGTTVLLGQGTAVAGHCYLCRSIDSDPCPRSCPQSMVEASIDHRIHSACLYKNLGSEGCST